MADLAQAQHHSHAQRMSCRVSGVGHYVPDGTKTNSEIETELGLPDGWISKRTGIETRRYVIAGQATSDIAKRAAEFALENSQRRGKTISADQIKGLILATSTPDHLLPPTAPRVAMELGCNPIPAFDMAVACSGFVYALTIAQGLTHTLGGPILVIAANILSKRVNPNDRGTAALFADAAGAMIVEPIENDPSNTTTPKGILGSHLESDGSGWDQLLIPAGGSRQPFDAEAFANNHHLMEIRAGQAVYRYAVESMVRCVKLALSQAAIDSERVDWWIPHQASGRVIAEVGRQLQVDPKQLVNVVKDYGNSSAATIPLACSLWEQAGHLQPDQLVVLTAAGAGLTSGAVVMRW